MSLDAAAWEVTPHPVCGCHKVSRPHYSGNMGTANWAGIVCILTGMAAAGAQTGAKYGTHDPHACASRKEPASGAITSALAVKYFTCDNHLESIGPRLSG